MTADKHTNLIVSLLEDFERTGDQDYKDAAELIERLWQALQAIISKREGLEDRKSAWEAGYETALDQCSMIAEEALGLIKSHGCEADGDDGSPSGPDENELWELS